jgi:hypothetical protein
VRCFAAAALVAAVATVAGAAVFVYRGVPAPHVSVGLSGGTFHLGELTVTVLVWGGTWPDGAERGNPEVIDAGRPGPLARRRAAGLRFDLTLCGGVQPLAISVPLRRVW